MGNLKQIVWPGYILTGLPTVDHCNVAIFKSQLEILKSIYPQPDFIIYLKAGFEFCLKILKCKY